MSTTTIIIGAGAVGAALAYELCKKGDKVTVVDRGDIGHGTTSASFSMNIATRKTPKHHFDLAVNGGHRHRELLDEFGIDIDSPDSWVHPAPLYEWAIDDYESGLIHKRVDRLNKWGHPAEWISREALAVREPGLQVDDFARSVVVYPDCYWYDAPLFAATMAQRARAAGAVFETAYDVVDIAHMSRGVSVTSADGRVLTAERICITAGPGAADLAALAGFTLPVNRIPGLVLTTEPVPADTLQGILLHPRVNIRPASNGGLVLQSYSEEAHLRPDSSPADVEAIRADVLELAERLLPGTGGLRLVGEAVGIRPVPDDGLPIVGWLDDTKTIYAVSAHSAINFSPALAVLAASELRGEPDSDEPLEAFRPTRKILTDPDAEEVDESAREMKRMYSESRNSRTAVSQHTEAVQ